jgi:hypothetical protein
VPALIEADDIERLPQPRDHVIPQLQCRTEGIQQCNGSRFTTWAHRAIKNGSTGRKTVHRTDTHPCDDFRKRLIAERDDIVRENHRPLGPDHPRMRSAERQPVAIRSCQMEQPTPIWPANAGQI